VLIVPYRPAETPAIEEALRRFGMELRRCRIQAGFSQASLAETSGVSQATISRLERGRAPHASLSKLMHLSLVLGHRLPLAFCPHEHACALERLDTLGVPARKVLPGGSTSWLSSVLADLED
jgi:transcriptional regulator with XRE-family HTH domain